MDEEQKKPEERQEVQTSPNESVSFSPISVGPRKTKISSKAIIGVIILIVFVVAGFFIFKDNKVPKENPSPSPVIRIGETSVRTPTPTPTPTPEIVDKTEISFEIQNGTGINGEAAYLRDLLKSLGYSNFKIGNAATTDNVTTSLTFAKSVPQTVQTEITNKLKEVYKEVDVKTSATVRVDVLIVTGLRKGASPKPTGSPTSSPSPTGAAQNSPSPTPTATP